MSRTRCQLTPALEQVIVSYVRAGGYPHVAAQAAGVSPDVFEQWLQRGEGPRAPARYRAFAEAVRQAQAQSRMAAEMTVHGKRPLDWLKSGPGKQTREQPGWSGPAKAAEGRTRQTYLLLEMQELFAELVPALEAYPEARRALNEIVEKALASRVG